MANFKSGHILLFLLHADVKMYKKSMKPLVNKQKIPFLKLNTFLDHRVHNVPEISPTTSLPWLGSNSLGIS